MNDDELRAAFDDLLSPLPPLGAVPPRTVARARRRRGLKVGALSGAGALAVAGAVLLGLPQGTPDRVVERPASPAPSASAVPPSPSPSPVAPPTVVLAPDGLGLATGASIRPLLFGADAATVRTGLEASLGAGEQFQTDCGTQVRVAYDGVTVTLDGSRLVGWETASPALSTADGVRVGQTLAELREARPDVQLSDGTLGAGFTSGELAGSLDGSEPSSLVTVLRAGAGCLAS